jgi:carboxymethylenebutenolidase
MDMVELPFGIRRTPNRAYSHILDNVQHGFNNDTTPRYDEAAAKLAWQRTISFFDSHLRS